MARSAKPQRPEGPLFAPSRGKKSFAFARTVFLVSVSLLWGLPPPASADEPPPADPPPPPSVAPRIPSRPADAAITSADRRFRVFGPSSAENLRLAEELSSFSRALERRLGLPVPFPRGQMPVVVQIPVGDAPAAYLSLQSWADGLFSQRLVTPPAPSLDPEDLAARVVSLLLSRCAAFTLPPSRRPASPPAPPDWLSAGLAQLLDSAATARDRAWVADALSASRAPSLETVLSWQTLPDGRWADKAFAAAAADAAFPDGASAVWSDFFRAASSARPHPDWFPSHTPLPTPAAWPGALAAWASASSSAPDALHVADPDGAAERQLVELLTFVPADWLDPDPDDLPPRLFAADLVSWRDASWVVPLADALALKIQSLKLGTSPELQSVLDAYAEYLAHFSRRPAPAKPHWWSSAADATPDPAFPVALRTLWTRAETLHRSYLSRRQQIRDFVTSWETRTTPPPPAPPPPPRTPIHLYLDSIPPPP